MTAQTVGRSIGMELLLILFIALKLTGQIDWSWWWVLAPLWGPLALIVLMAVPLVIAKVIAR